MYYSGTFLSELYSESFPTYLKTLTINKITPITTAKDPMMVGGRA
jgi:hypothetical protein